MGLSLSAINQMGQDEFSQAFGSIFECSPHIARQAWHQHPFADVTELLDAMAIAQQALSTPDKIALIRAHPDLGRKVKMSEASVQEQTGAGLSQLHPLEFEQFNRLNNAYREKFGFPFVMAVRGQTKETILQAFSDRLANSKDSEIERAMDEILTIAKLRLYDLVD